MKITIFNPDNTVRWNCVIEQHENQFFVEEDCHVSLFSGPLAVGNTPGEALDNFLAVETKLIENL